MDLDKLLEYYDRGFKHGFMQGLNWAAHDIKVATPQAGADGINPSKLSDNGPAHQIAVLPLARSPSDNTSQPEMPVTPCANRTFCDLYKGLKCDSKRIGCKIYTA